MNKLTLKFKDNSLEKRFNASELPAILSQVSVVISATIFLSLIGIIYWGLRRQYILLALYILVIFYGFFIYCKIIRPKKYLQLIPYIMAGYSISASFYQFVPMLIIHQTQTQNWILDIIIIFVTISCITPNFLLNILLQILLVIPRIIIRSHEEDSWLYIFGFIVYQSSYLYNDYCRIWNSRQQFLLKDYSSSSLLVLQHVQEPILIFKFDHIWQNLFFHFSNPAAEEIMKCEKIGNFRVNFIKQITVQRSRQSLYESIQENIKTLNTLHQFKARKQERRFLVKYQIVQTVELLVFVQLAEINKFSKSYPPILYKSLIKKLEQTNPKIYKEQIMKNLIFSLYYNAKLINVKYQEIEPQKLIGLVYQIFPKASIATSGKSFQALSNNLLLLYSLFSLIKRVLLVNQITISDSGSDQIKLELKGKFKKVKINNRVFKCILQLIGIGRLQVTSQSLGFTLCSCYNSFRS